MRGPTVEERAPSGMPLCLSEDDKNEYGEVWTCHTAMEIRTINWTDLFLPLTACLSHR